MDNSREILDFWFEGLTDATAIDKKSPVVKKWFVKDKKFDDEICTKFESDLIQARRGEHRNWETSAQGRLALVILLDQFSRNTYRNTLKAFETDSLALDLTLRSIKEKIDQQLQLIE